MKLKYHIFFDRRQLMSFCLTLLFIFATVESFEARATEGAWWIAITLLALLMGTLSVVTPCLYIMTPQGIHIVYAFGLIRCYIPWNTVRRLDVQYPKGTKHLPYFGDTFAIDGRAQGPKLFFTDNEIIRTRRARRLLERYTGYPVEGFMIDDLRAWGKKRKEKRERMRRHREKQAREARNREAKKSAQNSASRPTKK